MELHNNEYFITRNGIMIDLENLSNFDNRSICENDIVHALPMLCRFHGHIPEFYSVAEHSIRVFEFLRDDGFNYRVQMCGLLHDAAEIYVNDLASPLKRTLQNYISKEKILQDAVYAKYTISEIAKEYRNAIKNADRTITSIEMSYFGIVNQSIDISENRYIPIHTSIESTRKRFFKALETLKRHI